MRSSTAWTAGSVLAPGDLDSRAVIDLLSSPSWVQVADAEGTMASALAARRVHGERWSNRRSPRLIGPAATLTSCRGRGRAIDTRGAGPGNTLAAHGMRTVALHVHESEQARPRAHGPAASTSPTVLDVHGEADAASSAGLPGASTPRRKLSLEKCGEAGVGIPAGLSALPSKERPRGWAGAEAICTPN